MQNNGYFVTKIDTYTQRDLMNMNLVKKIENLKILVKGIMRKH